MRKELLHNITKLFACVYDFKRNSTFGRGNISLSDAFPWTGSLPTGEGGGRGRALSFLFLFLFSFANVYADPTPWGGNVASKFAGGTGTKADPYIISTADEFALFGSRYHNSYSYYKITEDIDLGGKDWQYMKDRTFYGHLIGKKEDGSKPVISNYVIDITAGGSYGLLGIVSNAEIINVGVSNVTVKLAASIGNTLKAGAFIGNVAYGSLVDGCFAKNITVNVGNESSKLIYCSSFIGFIGKETNSKEKNTVRNCTVNGCSLNLTGTVNEGNYATLVGRMENVSLVEDCSIENITITASNTLSQCNIAGLVGSMKGTDTTNRAVITRCSVKNLTYDIIGNLSIKVAIGSIVSWTEGGNTDITRCKTTGLNVLLGGDLIAGSGTSNYGVNADIRLGGMVGKLELGGRVTDCLLYGKNYIGSKANVSKTFYKQLCMNVGGIVGSTVDQSSSSKKIEIERCVAYCDFDFSGHEPATKNNFGKSDFVIGGVIGRLYKPNYIPKTLYYSGKVKAPYCVVGPLVGTFLKDKNAANFIYGDYSGVNHDKVNNANFDKWYYGDYKIWMSQEVKTSGKTKNISTTDGDGYASIDYVGAGSDWIENTIGGIGQVSKTILRYTQNKDYSTANLETDLTICPNYNQDNNNFPDYYMYYAQGVNRGNYLSDDNIDDVLTALRTGDDGPVWDVVGDKIVMDKFKATEKMKSGDAFTSVLTITTDDGTALPSGYTYEWKNGNTTLGTSTSIEVAREMQPKTVAVYISNGGAVVGARIVTIPRAEWFDAGAIADNVAGKKPTGTGTAGDPYQIATAEHLAWMGYHVSKTDAKNTEHYVLTADIDLAAAWWSPMNGMEEVGIGSFAGVFDGQAHTISNLKIDWDTSLGTAANFGLFSIIEGISNNQWAVVRNLVIDNASITKETNSTVYGNRYVGVLAGNIKQYSQIENVIVRHSTISSSATASDQKGKLVLLGGLSGKINDNGNNYRFLNISTDTDVDLSTLSVTSNNNVVAGGVVALWQANAKSCVTNVYALGRNTVPSGPTNIGSVFGQNFGGLTDATLSTIFYVNSSTQNVGTQKSLAEYSTTFLETVNEVVDARDELFSWVYSQATGYDFSHMRLKVVDRNATQSRFAKHRLEVEGLNLGSYTFKWILNEAEVATGSTYDVKPVVPGDNSTLSVKVLSNPGSEEIATIPVTIPTGKFAGAGTSTSDPYLIGCKEELQLLSYLSNQVGTYLYNGKTSAEYNQAYYELDDEVDMTGVTDFAPIGAVKDNYQAENCFRGHFDGKGLTVKNLNIDWLAGDVDAEVNRAWGLFGAVQGVSTSQKAVIQNLVIKKATLTHKTSNTSFYYGNGTSGNANNCYVGVLAGIVGANSTIQNIEISECSITDDGSDTYSVANHTLSVGGVIGRAQVSFSSDAGDINSSTTIRLLSSHCDITINHAAFSSTTSATQYKIDVAGIVGSMKSSAATATMPWPRYTYYTGKMMVVGKGMVSPVFSCAEFSGNTRTDYDYYCNLYVGRVNSSDSDPVSNVFYGTGFQIHDGTSYKDITDSYPAKDNIGPDRNPCDMGARTITKHSTHILRWQHNKDLQAYYYQGVNYGSYINTSNASSKSTVITAFNDGRSAANDDEIKGFGFLFGTDNKLHLDVALDITFTDVVTDGVHVLTVANKTGDGGLNYVWYNNGTKIAENTNVQNITLGVSPQLIYVEVKHSDITKYTTDVIDLPRGKAFDATYSPQMKSDFKGTFTVTPNATSDDDFTNGGYTYTYKWEKKVTANLTAAECLEINRDYIDEVRLKSNNSLVENWTSDIYQNRSNYVITYKPERITITPAEYAALTDDEQDEYTAYGSPAEYYYYDRAYVEKTIDDIIVKRNVLTETSNVLTEASEDETYYCTVTAIDTAWKAFRAAHSSEFDPFAAYVAKYQDETFTKELLVKVSNGIVVFLKPVNNPDGEGTGDNADGLTPEHPVRTWQKAYSLLKEDASWDDNIIVLMEKSDINATGVNGGFAITQNLVGNVLSEPYSSWKAKVDASHLAKNVTITGKYNNVVYPNAIIEGSNSSSQKYIGLFGDTRFQYITFNHVGSSTNNHSQYIFCQYHNLEMGEGIKMTGYNSAHTPGYGKIDGAKVLSFQIYGGLNNDARFRTEGGVLDMDAMEATMPHGKEGFTITLKSGHYSCVTVAGRQSNSGNKMNGLMGTPHMPVKCKVIVDIDHANNNPADADYDVGIVAASHEGAMYADMDIEIRSGYVARVANGMLGNEKNFTFTYDGGSYRFPDNTFMGRANILVNPNGGDNSKVVITELYGGSTGRGYSNDITIKNPFYGYSTVTINGGTFKILPDDNASKDQIFCGVFGAGAGGYNGIGGGDTAHPYTPDKHIAYWNMGKTVVLYGDSLAIQGKELTKPHCYNADGTFTDVDPTLTNTNILIKGGDFGSALEPIDGIYAGGSGFMSPSLFYEERVVPSIYGGNIYGKAGETVSTLTITGGKFYCKNGIFAGGRGTEKFYSEKSYKGKASEYTDLGKTFGDVKMYITGGTIYANVYGGGAGVGEVKLKDTSTYTALTNMARLRGNSVVNIGGSAQILSSNGKGGNVYGGGMLAAVDGTTTINLSGEATIAGNVYGAAQGVTSESSLIHTQTLANAQKFGKVNGNVTVTTSGIPTISGAIYGGAESAITNGNTFITLKGGILGGNVYGGGLGALNGSSAIIASANVAGNTYIRIDTVNYVSSTASYHVYGGGNVASKVEGKTEIVVNGCTTTDQMTVYGGGYGANTSAENTYITVNEFETEETIANTLHHYGLSSVYGGGYAGPVSGKANIALNGGQIFGDVFGGGNVATVGTAYPSSGDDTEKASYLNTYASRYGTEISMQGVGPVIYGNIYGGGNQAPVFGNTSVSISKGTYAGDIFGGGNGKIAGSSVTYADIYGSTNVYVNGAFVIWNKKWDSSTKSFNLWDASYSADNDFVYAPTVEHPYPVFKDNHNIYGGGNKACRLLPVGNDAKSGIATVDVARGFCDKDILSAKVWKDAYDDNKNPHFYVFGGGYGAYTSVGATKVNVGVNDDAPEGATTEEQLAKSTGFTFDSKSMAPRKRTSSGEGTDNASIGVYDNSFGISGFTVLGVIGGGYAGIVDGNTNVTVGGNTFMHRVFGGGYGHLKAYNELASDAAIADGKTRENLGEVGGDATVVTDGGYIYGDVFGGGAGVESEKLNGSTYTDFKDMGRVKGKTSVTISGDTQVFGSVYGGGDVANVGVENYTPDYTIAPTSASTFDTTPSLYGPMYSVTGYTHDNAQSFVHIIGGDIFGEVFAGGNGRKKAEADDYRTLGRIEGNALVHVADGVEHVPVIWNRIFGGCSYGTVNGNTLVHIEGGMLGHNIYGGGLGDPANDTPATEDAPASQNTGSYANVKGNTNVTIDGGTWLWYQMADINGNITTWKDVSYVVADNLAELRAMSVAERTMLLLPHIDNRFFGADKRGNPCFLIPHNIFGGGMEACVVGTGGTGETTTGLATVTINHSPLGKVKDADGKVINMLDETTVGGLCWYASISNNESPQFSVFGGGYGMNTKVGKTQVDVMPGVRFKSTDATIMPEEEGGKKPYAYIMKDYEEYGAFEDGLFIDYGSVTSEEKIKMYGSSDGSDTDVRTFLRYRASRLALSLGAPSFTFMNIYGGGFSGYVTGDALVTTDGQLACRNVFGGGLGSLPEKPTGNETYGEVGGDAGVYIHSGIVSLNVFGGGAGIESIDKDKDGTIDTDFPYIARVKGKTEVEVYGEAVSMPSDVPTADGNGYQTYDMERVLVFGGVYGGGDVACVGTTKKDAAVLDVSSTDFTTSVSIYGSSILSAAYAGGNGRVKAKCADYTKLGAVYGNTRFYVEATTRAYPYMGGTLSKVVIPYLWNRVYGGCQNGTVYGNTFVDLNGGYFAYNIFGGGWGNVDSLTVDGVKVANPDGITSADVTGNTNILIRGGEAKMTSLWNEAGRCWTEAKVVNKNGERLLYSPQYDPAAKKFTVNHNIYGGGRTACIVHNNTNVTMTKGMLLSGREMVSAVSTDDVGGFFNTNEWQEVYHKVGSPHFCVFGGGYGENTVIGNDTYVNVILPKYEMYIKDAPEMHDVSSLHSHFYSCQSVMDVIGGGYSGSVRGTTNVTIGGETFLRRVFGGGFYAPVGAAKVNIKSIDCNDIFGGGLMGDVGFTDETMYNTYLTDNPDERGKVTINIGTDKIDGKVNTGESIYVHDDVYGGNDVSGDILNKTTLNLSAGHVFGNVYGAGNGDYLYAVGRNKEKKVTVNEYYKMGKNTYDLVYTVPLRSFMPGISASTAAQRMVNCASYRPKVQNVEINLNGNDSAKPLELCGVYGGGNSATVSSLNGDKPTVVFNFGSNLKINNVFMGCDGDDMFDGSDKYRKAYEDLNSLHLEDEIDWVNNPANHAITQQYLPVSHENRPRIYEHLLDLYFQPVEMEIQPTVNWDSDMNNVTIGSFFCGGNRGSMNVTPNASGNIVEYTFPANLVITDKIVGGCNMANYKMPSTGVLHKGGYLLGERGKNAVNIVVKCQFMPEKVGDVMEGGNVYGGCYTSGTIIGDVHIDMKADMLANVTAEDIEIAKAKDLALCNVYGAGYGSLAYVRGNTKIEFGKDVSKNYYSGTASLFDTKDHGSTVNYIFGGGQQGNLVGNSKVIVYNGHVASSVCGGSYSGLMWGSTHVLVGNPKYYRVNKSGTYNLQRTDKWNGEEKNEDGSDVIKKSIKLLEHDIISEEVFDAIYSYDAGHTQATTGTNGNFSTIQTTSESVNWSDIDIRIDEAVYGGGYALSSGSSVAAGSYTVRKYDAEENLDDDFTAAELAALGANGTKGFGGNTTVLIWDAPTSSSDYESDHISVSSQTMSKKTDIKDTDDIYGYYYQTSTGKYKYIYQEGYNVTSTSVFTDAETEGGKIILYDYHGDGGMYGDGHLSFAEGFRSGELYGYGFAGKTPDNAKILNTFQRMDMLRITDCAVMLLGARDYNMSEISTTPYSIARVGEIQMVAQNVTNRQEGTLAAVTAKRSRNYLGLSNNIHYCGAIYSNVAFADHYRNAAGEKESGVTYIAKKQDYITNHKNDAEFVKRNDGTAANMIGVASGYSLKVQNIRNVSGTEKIFYGPLVGVVEISLINVRTDEGGGYVYAKNIHYRPESSGNSKTQAPRKKSLSTDAENVPDHHVGEEDFLETSGNFVFPYDSSKGRYVVDDCFNHGYDAAVTAGKTPEQMDDIHYWYVTGRHYYYNTTITGYTYDSSTEPLKFDSYNEDALMNLAGTPLGSTVRLKKVTWRSAHTDDCDIEVRNANPSCTEAYQKYQLVIGATSATKYDGPYAATTPDKGAYYVNVPFATTDPDAESGYINSFVGTTENADANIVLQLVDKADNSGTEYYQAHLSEPCKATIDLETEVAGEKYTYTIYLTINYVQGPDATGSVKVVNCALPGEMIEINKGSINIAADHSMSQYATIYRIGPREKDEHDNWHFKKDDKGNEIYYTYEVGSPYKAENGSNNVTSEMLSGVVFDDSNTTNPCIRVPAYYFMNGYGVQYCFKVYGLEEVFAVPMDDDSKLVVHNYHRMEPRRSGGGIFEGDKELNLHLDLAAKRAKAGEQSEPRIYIEDAIDLKKFASFLNAKTDDAADVGSKNDFGANMQFFVQDNITVGPDYVAPDNFKGTLHGDGHAIRGIDNAMSLFKTVGASANIHNLGLVSGRIVGGIPSVNNPSLHCCYEYGLNTVYRMNGTAVTNYTKDDWRYGKVAYELNEYYLNKRYVLGSEDTENAQDYVEKYYANGDYLYAGYSYDNHFEGSEFIRDAYLPNYGYAITTHDVTHPVDESRAVIGEGGTVTYKPLYNDNFVDAHRLKNDYFFFGQILNEETKDKAEAILNYTLPAPRVIDEESDSYNLVEDMNNRIYRAGGYYGGKNNHGFYYNSDAYVHDNGITAIDFYGYDDENDNKGQKVYTKGVEMGGNISSAAGTGMEYYYPVSDYGMSSIDLADGVTRNLLLYARTASDRAGILAKFNYTDAVDDIEATPESDIKAHVIDLAATPTTEYLHLVERTADNKNSEGGDCFNNDFNCPIAFSVHNRAWYTRVPRYYAANKNDAWEGMSLPFSVNSVVASFNGEISHFYGADNANAANDATDANNTSVGHEYWLRGFVDADASSETVKATFSRPGAGQFTGGTLTGDYSYFNSHFSDLYGAIYGDNEFSIYNDTREFTGYYFQQGYVPYIVSFPGATFKEFDLSGDFNEALTLGNHAAWDAVGDAHGFSFVEEAMQPQKITFSWYGDNSNVSNLNDANANIVGVTDDRVDATATTVGTITHYAAFSAQNNSGIYGIDERGTSFSVSNAEVLPFRTYMTVSSSAKAFAKPQNILIYEGGIEELPQAEDAEINGLRIYAKNRKIYVESPTALSLSLYTTTGQLVRIFDVVPGTNTYSGFANGIYIIAKKKLYIK